MKQSVIILVAMVVLILAVILYRYLKPGSVNFVANLNEASSVPTSSPNFKGPSVPPGYGFKGPSGPPPTPVVNPNDINE